MTPEEKLALIKRNTQEIVSEEELLELFKAKEAPASYIGFACTGSLHVGHMIPIRKIVDFLNAGCAFTFLIADLHAFLDDNKAPWELLDARYEYYKAGVIAVLKAFNAPLDKVTFVRGTDFELEKQYMMNVLHMVGETTLARAKRAASEVVRFGEEPKLGGFMYPFLQIEDVYALECDIAFGGVDQRGIYMLGRDLAPKMDRSKYVCVFTPLLPGLTGAKMSASDQNSKIDILDSPEVMRKKVGKAFCPAGEVKDNGVLAFLKHVIFPLKVDASEQFSITRPEKYGGNLEYAAYDDLEAAYVKGDIHPMDLKNGLADALAPYLEVIGAHVDSQIYRAAYPN